MWQHHFEDPSKIALRHLYFISTTLGRVDTGYHEGQNDGCSEARIEIRRYA
jgi:hypothetical protein